MKLGVGCWRSKNSMADTSTTTAPILDLMAGDCWVRCRLRSGIKNVSVTSRLMKSLTFVGVAYIATLVSPALDGGFLHDCVADSGSDCGRVLGSMPASQWCKVHPYANCIHEVTGLNGVLAISELDGGFLHSHCSDPGSDCGRLLSSTPATQRYKIRPEGPIPPGATIVFQEEGLLRGGRPDSGLHVNLPVY